MIVAAFLMDIEGIVVLMVYRGSLGYHKDGNTALFNAVYRDGMPIATFVGAYAHAICFQGLSIICTCSVSAAIIGFRFQF